MKYTFKNLAVITVIILFIGIGTSLVMKPADNNDTLNQLSTSTIWPKPISPRPILIKGVTIVDTKSGSLLKNMDILIAGGKIRRIAQTGAIPVQQDVRVIEAHGKYAVPGFVNMHMHVIDYPNQSEHLAVMLINGITSFRQMSGSSELLKLRKEQGLPIQAQQPTMLAMPGAILTPVNTHSIKEAQENVRRQKAEGADFIKIGMLRPDVFFAAIAEGKRIGIPVLGHVLANANMMATSDSGFRSVEHLGLDYGGLNACSTEEPLLRSMAPKIPWILNCLPGFMDKLSMKLLQNKLINTTVGTPDKEYERISRIVATFSEANARTNATRYLANGTWQCPTLSRIRGSQLAFLPEVKNEPGYKYDEGKREEKHEEITAKFEKELTPQQKKILINAYNLELKLVKIYDDMGVKMLTGTDGYLGDALHIEFDELAKAGLSPLHILQTTTINAAEFLGRTADMGTVEQGKIADLVLLDSNPLEDVRHLREINAVIHDGYFYSKTDLATLRTKVQQTENKL